jgi:hypothetical protein
MWSAAVINKMRPTKKIMDAYNKFMRDNFDTVTRNQKSYIRERKYEHVKIQEVYNR